MLPALRDEIDKIETGSDRAADDASLVIAARSGDNQAIEILLKRHRPRLLSFAFRFTGVREDAEDVVQQSLQKAFIHIHEFEGKSAFPTWLTRIAINEARMLRRKGRGVRQVPIDDASGGEDSALAFEIPDPAPSPEVSCLQHERERILSTALKALRPVTRKAIELRELGQLSTGEIARAMGLSVGAVKARLFHGRKKLIELLKRSAGCASVSRKPLLRPRNQTSISRDQLTPSACG